MRWFVVLPLRWWLGLMAWDVLSRVRLKPITWEIFWGWVIYGDSLPGMNVWKRKGPEDVDPSGPSV